MLGMMDTLNECGDVCEDGYQHVSDDGDHDNDVLVLFWVWGIRD